MTRYFTVFSDHVMTWLSRQLLINKWRDFFFHFLWPRYDVIITSSTDQLMTSIFCLFMTRTWRDFHVIYWQVYDEVFLIFSDHIMTWLTCVFCVFTRLWCYFALVNDLIFIVSFGRVDDVNVTYLRRLLGKVKSNNRLYRVYII